MEQEAEATLADTHRFWIDHIKRCRGLNQPMAVYAKANGLIVTTLYYWNKRLRALGLYCQRIRPQ